MAFLGSPYRIMYEAARLETGLASIQARVLRPDGTVDGPFSLTELPAPFRGRYAYNYPTSLSYVEGDYLAFVSSPMDGTFTTFRFELFKPWLTSVSPTGNVTGGVEIVCPVQLELPVIGTKDYQIFAVVTAPVGTLQDPDSNTVVLTITDNANTLVVMGAHMTKVQAGIYVYTYTVNAMDTPRPLNVRADCLVSGTEFVAYGVTETFLPPQSNQQGEYVPNLSLAINPGHNQAEFLAWLTLNGAEVDNPTSAHLQIYDGQDVLASDLGINTTPTSHGVFRFVLANVTTALVPGKAYTARVTIIHSAIPYTTLVPFTMAAQVSGGSGECCDRDESRPGTALCQEVSEVELGLPQVYGVFAVFDGTIDKAIGGI